jgi:NAD-dependent SIR2 family protein deacetylase
MRRPPAPDWTNATPGAVSLVAVDVLETGRSLDRALALLSRRPIVALTGAGLSTDSGIPDYRGPDSPPRTPMTYQQFLSGLPAQRRYWARSHVGWARMAHAEPNAGHRALAELERAGALHGLITQNVDGLHRAAGSRAVIDLHGRVSDVVCVGCGQRSPRHTLQARLATLNPGFVDAAGDAVEAAPDGDAELTAVDGFQVAWCTGCGGALKPDVVFFGENVPRERVAQAYAMVDAAGVLLVAGSSLTVMSGLRFVRHAHKRGTPVVIVNRGPTRGDPLADVLVDGGCSEVLTAVAATATTL